MDVIIIISIIFTLLGTLASCDSEFIHPPNWDPETSDLDFNNNRRYVAGETVQLKWETDLDHVELSLLQAVYPIVHGRPLDCRHNFVCSISICFADPELQHLVPTGKPSMMYSTS
jgi:hypothetical protein